MLTLVTMLCVNKKNNIKHMQMRLFSFKTLIYMMFTPSTINKKNVLGILICEDCFKVV